jgi:alpha-tubulin suppressor-like RCC1 family protein
MTGDQRKRANGAPLDERLVPATIPGVIAVTASSGGVRCWGSNAHGQLGDGTTTDRSTPPATDVLTGVQAVSVGLSTCALMTSGGLRCWGADSYGELGDGVAGVPTLAPPVADRELCP